MTHKNDRPEYLYKIVSPEQWQTSQQENRVINTPIDTDFIHLATEAQIAHVLNKFWKGKEHIIVKIFSEKLVGRLVCEANPGGTTKYYHLYEGIIPLDAVVT